MVTHSLDEIEERAEKMLAEFLGPDFRIPVDLEQIVEKLGGTIEVRVDEDLHPESLHVAKGAESFTVYVPLNTSPLRDRFTIAHELGHYALHLEDNPSQPVSFRRYGRDRNEVEANAFAGSLLMPRGQFTASWNALSSEVPEPALSKVAREFQVSRSAASVRVKVLSL